MTDWNWYDEATNGEPDQVITLDQFKRAVPDCRDPAVWVDLFDHNLMAAGIEHPAEIAMMLAQFGHESRGFNALVENLNYSTKALLKVFGRHRITAYEAEAYGRNEKHAANQRALANTLYGGEWGYKNLGNREEGDGWRYRGRGIIHLTGRANYERFDGELLEQFGIDYDLSRNPDVASSPDIAVKLAICFWLERVDYPASIEAVTRQINGGLNGIEDRRRRLELAEDALL